MKDILQEQLEAEFRGGEIDFGDPLDPEEASEEDIAAELLRHGRGRGGEVKKEDFDDAGSTGDWAEVDESDLGDESLNEGEEETLIRTNSAKALIGIASRGFFLTLKTTLLLIFFHSFRQLCTNFDRFAAHGRVERRVAARPGDELSLQRLD
jgi:hypothetical protein